MRINRKKTLLSISSLSLQIIVMLSNWRQMLIADQTAALQLCNTVSVLGKKSNFSHVRRWNMYSSIL